MSSAFEAEQIKSLFEKHTGQSPIQIRHATNTSAQLNLIYFVTLTSPPSTEYENGEFVLRLSKKLHPRIKTQNEIGWLTFLRHKSKLKVPKVLFWSDSSDELGYEYTVLEKLPGETLCNVWETIDPLVIIREIINIVLELRLVTKEIEVQWFGGMTADGTAGPFVEITSYTEEHIHRYWPSTDYPAESYQTLNLTRSFSSWNDYLEERIKRDIHVIQTHHSCSHLRQSFLSRLHQLLSRDKPNKNVQGYISHRDLHFGNLLWSRETNSISGILDWELAGIYPLSDWNPGNTCWTVVPPKASSTCTQQEIMNMFDDELTKQHGNIVEDCNDDDYIYRKIVNLTFWIVFKTVEGGANDDRVKQWLVQWKQYKI